MCRDIQYDSFILKFHFLQDIVTPEKLKAHHVTPTNSGKRGALHCSSESSTLKEFAEGEEYSTRLRQKHVKLEKE